MIVIALKGKIGIFGGITYDDEDTIKSQLRVKYNNKLLKLLKNNEIDPDTKNFITLMKPMIAGMLGEMGDNMQFYLFKPNEPIDVYKKGELEFELGDFVSTNNLPLGSLLEEKKCPQTNKLHNGKWKYCPFHGGELIQKK
ncbi:hypothetical protein BTO05_10475 [Winogradskyella sp. PC-19]|uniref:hypothetical protein n=1 Tax=unclassified Winogradskyella TaxID=2615021 RepID=UPI000B3C1577|nr:MULTISPECIES: hypothetical protein [unclassified Winogradskyella]ARV10039.1 hypothetical protein BTO05_10475 [Winogradskyella sp. PC-19]RZN79690.1 MAG: hypothetical protein EVB12_04595 [Winogradskyella sp.]